MAINFARERQDKGQKQVGRYCWDLLHEGKILFAVKHTFVYLQYFQSTFKIRIGLKEDLTGSDRNATRDTKTLLFGTAEDQRWLSGEQFRAEESLTDRQGISPFSTLTQKNAETRVVLLHFLTLYVMNVCYSCTLRCTLLIAN